MKKLLSTVASLLLCVMIAMTYIGCSESTTKTQASSFVSIDINPSIELTLDQNDKVLSVRGTNEDGQVLLYGETGLVGLDIEDAISKITDLAVELGYISEDNKVVDTSVTSKVQNDETELLNKINAKITAKARDKGIEIRTDGQGAYSLLRQLEQLKEQYPDNQAIQDLTLKQFKLVLSASETGEITIEAAAELDPAELIKIVSSAHAKIKDYATDDYDKIKAEAQLAYDKVCGAAIDGVYIGHDIVNGTLYNSYKTTARVLNGVADILLTLDGSSYEITEEQVNALLTALNLTTEDVELIQNSKGVITLKSIYAYVDKVIKNTEDEQVKEQIKNAIDGIMTDVENAISENIVIESNAYVEEIKSVVDSINKKIEEIPTILPAIEELKTLLSNVCATIEDGLTYSEIKELADLFEEKAEEIKNNIEKNLSNKERKSLEQKMQNLLAGVEHAKETLTERLDAGCVDAQNRLNQLKEQRRHR